jgi:LmbE family N-acetylglucosaminyl deacetylase
MVRQAEKSVAVIVAHPDDETLWAGGTILSHAAWKCFIVSLCRGKDKDRSSRFYSALRILNCEGIMGDLDDGPQQEPLEEDVVENAILELLPVKHFDLILSHNPTGEYTRHLRHEEAGRAVIKLWNAGKISTSEVWVFAYTDNDKKHYPVAIEKANISQILSEQIWLRKYYLITETYGFKKGGFEAETTPRAESFWQFTEPEAAEKWLNQLIKKSI